MNAVYLLAESHFAIHTYPERNYLSVDVYTCGSEGNPLLALSEFMSNLEVSKANILVTERGA